ncbi:hypothetical protein IDH44_16155 [Paenibacillus sp. IB182496]|uniref:Uncharacterized protein n=1 Tax=Paenibacillus sabuli TaxID=2772509 RepID=A0A927BW44_9BACL|nr:hypothetical protein [Paenibacillus sabuli]MBD2846730.1 hypothetical protein [Paenibacillus sabuli]
MESRKNPLFLSVIGLLIVIFGVVDVMYVNKLLGGALLFAGLVLGVTGIVRYSKWKEKLGS